MGLRVRYGDETVENFIYKVEYDAEPYGEALQALGRVFANCPLIIGFNLKFDLSWLARYGIKLTVDQRVFDCQLAYFMLDSQRTAFPSLNHCLGVYGLSLKSDVVEREYWSLGIDTTEVPLHILTEYLETDLVRTEQLYSAIQTHLRSDESLSHMLQLIRLHQQDLMVLQEMESNGILFDWDGMGSAAKQLEAELKDINGIILSFVPDAGRPYFNGQSGDHLSWLLYGGIGTFRSGTPTERVIASGPRIGQTETRYKWSELSVEFPRICAPLAGSELKKKGFYSVDEETLTNLEANKEAKILINALLARAEKEKLLGTYYHGIPEITRKYDWQDGLVHGTYNQCRVVTGRLSSEKPNQQNRPAEVDQFVITRFPEDA